MNTEQAELQEIKRVLEAAILTGEGPLSLADMGKLFVGRYEADLLRRILDELRGDWADRGVELVSVAGGWRFQSRSELQVYLDRISGERPPKYSRAVLETLAIIAYRQPVTRGDIEDIRGVGVSPGILKALEARGWIDSVGHREVPGRPALYATTKAFLNDLGLRTLQELPPLDDLGSLIVQPPLPEVREGTAPALSQATEEAFPQDQPHVEVISPLTTS